MRIGSSIFLIAVGAILTFAINADVVSFVNIDMVCWIIMGVGVVPTYRLNHHVRTA